MNEIFKRKNRRLQPLCQKRLFFLLVLILLLKELTKTERR